QSQSQSQSQTQTQTQTQTQIQIQQSPNSIQNSNSIIAKKIENKNENENKKETEEGACLCELSDIGSVAKGGVRVWFKFASANAKMLQSMQDKHWHGFVLIKGKTSRGDLSFPKLLLGRVCEIKFQKQLIIVRVSGCQLTNLKKNTFANQWLKS
ncbi:hypothetical protein RFI_39621, partial [Reticulomyxa filosa]